MLFKTIKKIVSPSLASKLVKQLKNHKNAGYTFHNDIVCTLGKDYSGPYINACIKSFNPNATSCESNQIWFFKLNVPSIEDGFNALTIEVSQATSKYPQLVFFHWLSLLEQDGLNYVKNSQSLSLSEKANMILRGNEFKAVTFSIHEKYTAGSWHISNKIPWQDVYEYENSEEYLFDKYLP